MASQRSSQNERRYHAIYRCVECGQEHDGYDSECSLECCAELVHVVEAPNCQHVTPGPLIESSNGVAHEYRVCALCGARLYD